jgi:hypothetical protein
MARLSARWPPSENPRMPSRVVSKRPSAAIAVSASPQAWRHVGLFSGMSFSTASPGSVFVDCR